MSSQSQEDWLLIIGSDTIVVMDEKIYEKPADKEDAFRILKLLSGRSHMVYSGVTLVKKTKESSLQWHSFYEGSEVRMAELSDEVIKAYIETGEPLDKAGGYGIQDLGATLVHSINGDFFNVEGFPAYKFSIELKKFLQ
jgi:septum formation protein